jgi:hypothetical protein
MHDRDEDELTAAESEAFDALPREAMPGRLLEERVVSELHARGLLGTRQARHIEWSRLGITAAAAAGVALFASGLAVGQWLGARHTANAMLALQRQDAVSTAAAVQRTGSAYLSALGALAQASSSADPQEVAHARETAQSVLQQAANEMVRLAPDDPVSAQILQGLDRARVQQGQERDRVQSASTKPDGKQRLVWF